MYAEEILSKIKSGFDRCSRSMNFYDWEFELEFQIRVALGADEFAFTIGTRLLEQGVKNPDRKRLIAICNEVEFQTKKLFVERYFFSIPENIRGCRAFKDQFERQIYGWVDPFQN
jgi:hypothetical protein